VAGARLVFPKVNPPYPVEVVGRVDVPKLVKPREGVVVVCVPNKGAPNAGADETGFENAKDVDAAGVPKS